MNVLMIGNLAEDRQESMQRFTALLHHGLRARGHAVTVLAPTLRLARLHPPYRYGGLPKYLGYVDKFVLFPRQLRQWVSVTRPDVVHIIDHAHAMYASAVAGVPVLATCHDLLQVRAARGEIPQQPVHRMGRRYQEWIRGSLDPLALVACVSAKTRADVLRLTGQAPSRVVVVPNALNHAYRTLPAGFARSRIADLTVRQGMDSSFFDHAPGGFLLHVGGAHWYKNREGLIAIYAALRHRLTPPPKLVLVGPPLSAALEGLASRLGVREHLVVFPSVTNAELEALYGLAEGLLFPSWEEGFGWPIAEAQACGCQVFTSDRAPMTEVGGRSAIYFDPADPEGAAQVIAAAWPGRKARQTLGLVEAHRWRPELMLAAYEGLYQRIAE